MTLLTLNGEAHLNHLFIVSGGEFFQGRQSSSSKEVIPIGLYHKGFRNFDNVCRKKNFLNFDIMLYIKKMLSKAKLLCQKRKYFFLNSFI